MKYRYVLEFETRDKVPSEIIAQLQNALDVQLEGLSDGDFKSEDDESVAAIGYWGATSTIAIVVEPKLNKKDVYFETRPYYTSHLREPKGRGSWAFEIHGEIFWAKKDGNSCLTYADAKKVAAEFAASVNCPLVKVLP